MQNAPKGKVISFFKSHKANFPIFQGGRIKGINVRGIPQFYIFDHKGKLVFKGRRLPADKIEEAVNNAPDVLTGEGPYKKLGSLARRIRRRKELGKITAQLREKVENATDPEEKEEANMLLTRLSRYAQRLKAKAEGVKDEAPLQYYNLYQQLAEEFKDDEIGTEAQQVLDELKKDKQFQAVLDAESKFVKIKNITEEFKPCHRNKPLDIKNCKACRKKNGAKLRMITTLAKKLIKKYPETSTARKVKDFLTELGIKFD